MQLVGLDRWPRFLADLHERVGDPVVAAAAPAALAVAASGRPEVGSGPSGQLPAPQKSQTEQNATDLAKLMVTEAGGTTAVAMTAVGWTVRNRMVRNGRSDVSDVWTAYRHGKDATPDALRIARGILDGSIPDPRTAPRISILRTPCRKRAMKRKGRMLLAGSNRFRT